MAINWVLGAVEQETGRCLLEVVANRDRATLEPILDLWLLPGTHIISDGWAAYIHLDQLNQGVYLHNAIIHEHNFDDPLHDWLHTKTIGYMDAGQTETSAPTGDIQSPLSIFILYLVNLNTTDVHGAPNGT